MPEMTGEVPRVSVCLHHDQTGMADVLVIESCINPIPSGGGVGGFCRTSGRLAVSVYWSGARRLDA